jgi:hypothetical protein
MPRSLYDYIQAKPDPQTGDLVVSDPRYGEDRSYLETLESMSENGWEIAVAFPYRDGITFVLKRPA